MSTMLAPEPTTTDTGNDDELTHITHSCDLDMALCGADVSEDPEVMFAREEDICVVCNDLMLSGGGVCPRCGKPGW